MVGKKAKDPKDWKVKTIIVRVSQDEYQALKQLSVTRGHSISDLVRTSIWYAQFKDQPYHGWGTTPAGVDQLKDQKE